MIATVNMIAERLVNGFWAGHKLLICGNGGSAADSQHIAAEFIGRFKLERRPLPAISLAADTAVLTAIGNDYGFDQVFARQVEALGQPGDTLLALSTSGRSPNIVAALRMAKRMGLVTIGMTGNGESPMRDDSLCGLLFVVPSTDTAEIQQGYMVAAHQICGIVEGVIARSPVQA